VCVRVCERVKARQGPRQKRIGGANKPDVIYLQRLMTEADVKQGPQQQLQMLTDAFMYQCIV